MYWFASSCSHDRMPTQSSFEFQEGWRYFEQPFSELLIGNSDIKTVRTVKQRTNMVVLVEASHMIGFRAQIVFVAFTFAHSRPLASLQPSSAQSAETPSPAFTARSESPKPNSSRCWSFRSR